MKKATLILISILLALFAFTACNNSIDYIIDDQPTDPKKLPLTLEFIDSGKFWVKYYDYDYNLVEYSINGGERAPLNNNEEITVSVGDKICFYRDVDGARSIAYHVNIKCDSECYVYGNVMSLFKSENFDELYSVPVESLMGLFYENTNIRNHDEIDLVLPATELAEGCYKYMFYGCTGLTRAPELPATTLAVGCYYGMFYGCTGLTVAPELPAKTLTDWCYISMFQGCTGLTTVPEELPATTLANYCYYCMFEDCTSLTTAPVLPATSLSESCYAYMFSGCTSLETAPEELPATTLAYDCYDSMFYGCTSLEIAPVLPAETLANYCYNWMFRGCSSLTSITCLAIDISADSCTNEWVYGVPTGFEMGTFTCHHRAGLWNYGINGIPDGWNVIEEAT